MSEAIHFEGTPAPVRDDIVAAHTRFWERLAAPGTWWTGEERVAIASETRAARDCALCAERRQAVSPYAVDGEHQRAQPASEVLPAAAVDAVHRITTDASRLTASWLAKLQADGLDDTRYIELVGIVVAIISTDAFCRGLGVPPHPLPAPLAGEPSRKRPASAVMEQAWVPMIPVKGLGGDESDLWRPPTGNVIRAMSLVPDAVRDLKSLSAAHYLPVEDVVNPAAHTALSRPQIELVAGRVSALNECFY
jgi:hypothetical protein